jgi:hypothetical protein
MNHGSRKERGARCAYGMVWSRKERHIDFWSQECTTQRRRCHPRLERLSYPLAAELAQWYAVWPASAFESREQIFSHSYIAQRLTITHCVALSPAQHVPIPARATPERAMFVPWLFHTSPLFFPLRVAVAQRATVNAHKFFITHPFT